MPVCSVIIHSDNTFLHLYVIPLLQKLNIRFHSGSCDTSPSVNKGQIVISDIKILYTTRLTLDLDNSSVLHNAGPGEMYSQTHA